MNIGEYLNKQIKNYEKKNVLINDVDIGVICFQINASSMSF